VKPFALAALAVAAVAVGVSAYRYSQHRVGLSAVPDVQAPVAELVATIPEFRLADREGRLRSLADWPDRALIVNFWATWCAPCRREIPLLKKIQLEQGPAGFQVIGIAADFRDKVLTYADEMQIEYPLLIGEQEALDAAAAFGVEVVGFPFTIFSDRRGRIVAAHLGELTEAEASLILGAVREVDAGRLQPEEARARIEAGLPALQHEAGDPG
jgi:thiol-disulfide isomerase/thioredoxin